ncbi:LuxR family transcriptional regulator [Pseudohoeflea suaedae]|uniref:LuxR family transcriptional regulator n=1 Tax=Pseudohoeflea suaedae TaxID=877384 RepID=A0A4V3A774_9HYPH|nr:autoinducer binding domain-containing protein [Pseudohoeflea suaedae]TDH37615.1 LuxR family transcriptional regulator [Pseudohoeflea suaedae]
MDKAALFRFLELDISDASCDEINVLLEDVVDEAGFDFFTLTRQPLLRAEQESLVLAGRWPDGWPEIYVKRKYSVIDPTLRYLGYCQNGFRWREAAAFFEEDPQAKRIMRMLKQAKKFGLEDGYVFPVHGRQGLAGTLTVAGRPVELSAGEVLMFEAVARKALWALLESSNLGVPVSDPANRSHNMTKREIETLSLLAQGYTSGEMGSTLGLSTHTVDWYMNGIQNKLDARNRHHAVAIAFRRGLIS